MYELNYMLIGVATVAQFILGAVWYSPLMFGKWWMQIMEVAHLDKESLAKMQKEMAPFYALQLMLTLVTTFCLANVLAFGTMANPDYSVYGAAFWTWFGFIATTQVSTVIWGNTKKKYWAKQLFVMLSMQLVGIMLATLILSM
jgi:hypothetical protein